VTPPSEIVLEPSASAAATPRGLRRILGVGFGLAVIVGSTLGVGILRTPGLVAGQVSSPGIILAIWLVGGLYTFLCAVCLAELGTMYPEAGGYYVYARRAFTGSLRQTLPVNRCAKHRPAKARFSKPGYARQRIRRELAADPSR
jgi:amino acid permease